MTVSLDEMMKIDPSLLALADLPRGWCALRVGRDQPWRRAEKRPPVERKMVRDEQELEEVRKHGELWSVPHVEKNMITDELEVRKAEKQEELWSVPQYGLITLMGIVTIFGVLFSFFTSLHIDWHQGLFVAAIIALIAWLVVGVRRMVKLSDKTPLVQEDRPENRNDDETTGTDNRQ